MDTLPQVPGAPKAPKSSFDMQAQIDAVDKLRAEGYVWSKNLSAAAAGVVMLNADGDMWFFGLDGTRIHNPEGLLITL